MRTDQRKKTAGVQQTVGENDLALNPQGLRERVPWRTLTQSPLIRQRQVQAKIRGCIYRQSADGRGRHIQRDAEGPHEKPYHGSGKKQGQRHHQPTPERSKTNIMQPTVLSP